MIQYYKIANLFFRYDQQFQVSQVRLLEESSLLLFTITVPVTVVESSTRLREEHKYRRNNRVRGSGKNSLEYEQLYCDFEANN